MTETASVLFCCPNLYSSKGSRTSLVGRWVVCDDRRLLAVAILSAQNTTAGRCSACDLLQQQPHTNSGCTDQQQKLYSECHQLFVKYDGNSSYTVVMLNTPKEGISRFTCCMIEIKLYVSLMHTIGLG